MCSHVLLTTPFHCISIIRKFPWTRDAIDVSICSWLLPTIFNYHLVSYRRRSVGLAEGWGFSLGRTFSFLCMPDISWGGYTIWGKLEQAPQRLVCCKFSIYTYIMCRTSCLRSLLALILCHALIRKQLNHRDHLPIQVVEVTAWQSVDAICHCCLTLVNAMLKSLDQSVLATLLGANACQTRVLSSVHAIST